MDTFAGYSTVELVGTPGGVAFAMSVFYPASTPSKPEKLGPYTLDISLNAAPQDGVFPLVILSHGSGGSPLVYRTLAQHLASSGFIVGLPEHPFNNRSNNRLMGTLENLTNRPGHIRTAVDWFFSGCAFTRFLKPDAVALIGHSLGGYTALAAAGGVATSFPNESPDGQTGQIKVIPDSRVKALVLLAPAAVWFMAEGALKGVTVPILLLTGEKDAHTPAYHAQIILDGVLDKTKIQHRIIPNAGHFSFLSPFPETMVNAGFPPSQDPAGFDREHFQHILNAEVQTFLSRTI